MRMASHHDIEHHHELLTAWFARLGDPVTASRPLVRDAAADLARIAVAAPDDLTAAFNPSVDGPGPTAGTSSGSPVG